MRLLLTEYLFRCLLLFSLASLIVACASFDKTNIRLGQRVQGLGFSFEVPTEGTWSSTEYGTGNRIKLIQLNHEDIYYIVASLSRGPAAGMFDNAEAHLQALQTHMARKAIPRGFVQYQHKEWIDARYGNLCVRQSSSGEDWAGRNNDGPAKVDVIALTCSHPEINNVLISFKISRRYEVGAAAHDLEVDADALFSSIDFHRIE